MIKTHWVKTAVACGTALTLSIAVGSVTANTTASTLCKETEMAGISLSMDKYFVDNIDEMAGTTPAPTQEATAAPTQAAAATQAPAATKAPAPTPQVAKQFLNTAISVADDYVNIRKSPSTDAKILGKLYEGCAAKVLESKNGWSKIESGSVTGYIKSEFLATGAQAEKLADKYGKYYAKVKPGTITLNVRKKPNTSATIMTQIPEDESYEVISIGKNWVKVSIDGERGFVAKEFVNLHANFKKAVSIEEEEAEARRKAAAEAAEQERLAALAAERQQQQQQQQQSQSQQQSNSNNNSTRRSTGSTTKKRTTTRRSTTKKSTTTRKKTTTNSNKSTYSGGNSYSGSGNGSEVASYARKFVGNPYSYGGASLTRGTDCSGFTMSVYAQFGYSLPHSAAAQAGCGRKVSLSSLQPGDLVFYKNGGHIGHVAMYIGGGQVVHASNPTDGIKISNVNYRKPCSARRIVG